MKKILSTLLIGLLISVAATTTASASKSDMTPGVYSYENSAENQQKDNEAEVAQDNSFYISDEEIQEMQPAPNYDDASTSEIPFDTRVINSSHFSSGTATKTWLPLHRGQ